MIKITDISAPIGFDEAFLKRTTAKKLRIDESDIICVRIARKSVDARKKNDVHFSLSLEAEVKNEVRVLQKNSGGNFVTKAVPYVMPVRRSRTLGYRPVVVGFGPAGFFAALTLAKAGAKPIVIERGADVDARTAAVKSFWSGGNFSESTNVQFGEGGAGTFSDGKLTTGIKDLRISEVFHELVRFGAPEEILISAKPHIGTDMLSRTVKAIREEIIALGGDIIFGARLVEIQRKAAAVSGAVYEKDGGIFEIPTESIILAVGHSARDTFEYLNKSGVAMSRKSFAVGMRIEHLQEDVNRSLYGCFAENKELPAADYKLSMHLPSGRSVYTFCMCPGGEVVAAASEQNTVVTNGMSCFARSGKNANSALLVGVNPEDFGEGGVLAGVEFQRRIERSAFSAGGGTYAAPVTLVGDFIEHRSSVSFGKVKPSYTPGTAFSRPEEFLPEFVTESIRLALPEFARKISCFADCDAVLTGAETRSSSPVRIERGENLQSKNLAGLFPCGEGAGYAGGIVSAAVDGIKCAEMVML